MAVYFPPDGANFIAVAGSTAATYDTILFSNQNGITFGLNGSVLTASHNGLTGHTGPTGIAVAGSTLSDGTLQFSNANNITFGMNGSTITASYGGAAAGGVAVSAGANSRNSGTVQFANSNNVSFGMDTNGVLTASANAGGAGDGFNIIAAGGSTANTSGTILFANSNGISFGLNGTNVTASHNGLTQQSAQPVAYQAANGSALFSTLVFANSNGISFSTGTQGLYAVYTVPTQSVQPVAYSGSNGSALFSTLVFANSNGITFATGTQGIYASHNALTQQSTQPYNILSAGTQVANTTGTIAFGNANGISFGMSNSSVITASYTVPTQSTQPVAYAVGGTTNNFSTIAFANSNGVTFSTGTQGVFATVKTDYQSSNANYLTTQTIQPVAYEVAGTVNTFGTLKFANSNGLTWSTGTQGVYVTGLGGGGGVNVAAGGVTQGTGTVNFANSNGISFGLSANGAMTGSYEVSQMAPGNNIVFSTGGSTVSIHANAVGLNSGITNGLMTLNTSGLSLNLSNHLTTQTVQPVAYAVGGTTNNFSTIAFVNTNGVSWSTSTNGIHATVATNYLPLANSNNYFYTSNNTFANNTHVHGGLTLNVTNLLTSITSNSNGLTININNSNTAYIPLANSNNYFYTSNNTFANSTHSHGNPTLALTGLLGTTASNSAGFTLSLSNNAAGGVAIAAGSNGATAATTISTGTIQFANSNGVTFGLSNNGVMTASVQAGAAAGVGAVGIGASSLTSGTLAFDNGASGNVSFGWNGSTITASAPAGGGAGYTALTYQNRQLGASTALSNYGNNTMWLVPMRIGAPVSGSTILQMMSLTGSVTSNQTNTVGATLHLALYKNTAATNSSRFDSIWSTQALFTFYNGGSTTMSFAYAHGGTTFTTGGGASSASFQSSIFGLRFLTFTIGSILDTGLYAYGLRISTSSAGGSSVMRSFNPIMDSPISAGGHFMNGGSTVSSLGFVDAGFYKTTTASPPASFLLGDIAQSYNVVPYVKIGAA